jgi:hypothetical protein
MSRNYIIIGLVLVAAFAVLLGTDAGRPIVIALLGGALLPLWALLLASIFLIVCSVLGSIILAIFNAVKDRKAAEEVAEIQITNKDHPKAA